MTDFEIVVNNKYLRIGQGYSVDIVLTVENKGNVEVNLTFYVKKDCCSVSDINGVLLKPKEKIDIPVEIHAALNEKLGKYVIVIGGIGGNLEKTATINLMVTESPIIKRYNMVKNALNEIKASLNEYKKSGIDVSGIEELVGIIESYLNRSEESIARDDIEGLDIYLTKISEHIGAVQNQLAYICIYKFLNENKWNLLLLLILIFILSYAISEIIIPYYRLGRDIATLKEKENTLIQSRIETEKQYFTRRIDEATFNKIIIETQQNILRVRSEIKNKTLQKLSLIHI